MTNVPQIPKQLCQALVRVQEELKPVKSDAENPFHKSRYATLAAIMSIIQPLLHKNGLILLQRHTEPDDAIKGGVRLETLLVHIDSGESLASTMTIPCKADAQSMGSATTYARRYMLATMLGVVVDDDDDGNSASVDRLHARSQQQGRHAQANPSPQSARSCQGSPMGPPQGSVKTHTPSVSEEQLPKETQQKFVLPVLSGVSFQDRKSTDGRAFVVASGDTQKHLPMLKAAGFQYRPEQKVWWRYYN